MIIRNQKALLIVIAYYARKCMTLAWWKNFIRSSLCMILVAARSAVKITTYEPFGQKPVRSNEFSISLVT